MRFSRTEFTSAFLLTAVISGQLSHVLHAADPKWAAITLEEAKADPDFALQGEYVAEGLGAQIVAQGDGKFRVVLYKGGLPGAGWDRNPPLIEEEDTEGVTGILEDHKLTRTERKSPTLGAAPPKGAIVLFDGTKETFAKEWEDGARISPDGLLMEGATSNQKFHDFTLHAEFMVSYMPGARGQARANSGVYYQGRYETQVLDSFGLEGKNNETGGIYEIRDPDLNMCLPPLTWQTYDVDFTAARFDSEGKKTSNARVTVRLNGVVVQPDIEIPRITRAAPVQEGPEDGPIYLQNHGNPIRYRNIWVIERDADREARRPIIPAYERFYAHGENDFEAGRILVGELGCAICHKPDEQTASLLLTKQAPRLTDVGKRVDPDWILKFLADPHGVKPGTLMPNRFVNWEQEKKDDAILKLTNFLASTGQLPVRQLDPRKVRKGEKAFHEVGCTVCHAPRNGELVNRATTVPLDGIENKYSIPSLTEFLKNPHASRPSGRMPNLNLEKEEPEEIASYLLSGADRRALPPNVRYAVYHGDWQEMPSLDELKPVSEGTCAGIDIGVAGRTETFAVRFEGFLHIDKTGKYNFFLGSDDGSRLSVDGNMLIDNDGIHPHTVKSAELRLEPGVHSVRIDYFEFHGEESLTAELDLKGVRVDLGTMLTPTEAPLTREDLAEETAGFRFNPELVAPGRELFMTLGCAGCHEVMENAQRLKPQPPNGPPRALAEINLDHPGCLNPAVTESLAGLRPVPADFELSPSQVAAITAFIKGEKPSKPMTANEKIHQTLSTFNCYACHSRGGQGGPEASRNRLFMTTIPEMGDEGRIPPPLDGVGDKLREDYLAQVLRNGANERSYMRVRMPKFQLPEALASTFAEADARTEASLANFEDPVHRVKSTGRQLVGDQGLACIKCHTFGRHKATGIQAVSLTNMTKRIRQDWFLRYLFNPGEFRPGTRMPTGFPNGQATIRDIYEGDPSQQISAIWTYLEEGDQAGVPAGLIAEMIELKPIDEPIIYRNFIEGLTPRGIAVGYPEHANLAFDANDLCLKLVWQGRFIDASQHWVGRGPGKQVPLGDHIMTLEPSLALGELASLDTAWPMESARERGWSFKGYRLNDQRQPTFLYTGPNDVNVTDFPKPVRATETEGTFLRTLTVEVPEALETLYFLGGAGKSIERQGDGFFLIDGAIRIRVTGGGEPVVRTSGGRQELMIPVRSQGDSPVRLVQEIVW